MTPTTPRIKIRPDTTPGHLGRWVWWLVFPSGAQTPPVCGAPSRDYALREAKAAAARWSDEEPTVDV